MYACPLSKFFFFHPVLYQTQNDDKKNSITEMVALKIVKVNDDKNYNKTINKLEIIFKE
jgi:hypothetical protein